MEHEKSPQGEKEKEREDQGKRLRYGIRQVEGWGRKEVWQNQGEGKKETGRKQKNSLEPKSQERESRPNGRHRDG